MKKFLERIRLLLNSFRFRLTLWFVLILSLIMGGFSLFIYFRQVQVLQSETVSRLTAQASQLELFFASDLFRQTYEFEEELEHLPNISSDLPLLRPEDRFAIIDASGQVVQKSEHFSSDSLTEVYNSWLGAGPSTDAIEYRISGQDNTEREHQPVAQTYLFIGTPFRIGQQDAGILLLGSPVDPEGPGGLYGTGGTYVPPTDHDCVPR